MVSVCSTLMVISHTDVWKSDRFLMTDANVNWKLDAADGYPVRCDNVRVGRDAGGYFAVFSASGRLMKREGIGGWYRFHTAEEAIAAADAAYPLPTSSSAERQERSVPRHPNPVGAPERRTSDPAAGC